MQRDFAVRDLAGTEIRLVAATRGAQDPVFSFHPDGAIEDLVRYWTRMVRISYDASNGLMALRVLAFDEMVRRMRG